jgi:hypothetical protein
MCHSSILRYVMWGRRGRDWKRWVMAVWKVGAVVWDFGLGRRKDVSLDIFEGEEGSFFKLKCRRQTVSVLVLVLTNGSLLSIIRTNTKHSFEDVRHSQKRTNSSMRELRVNQDASPGNVHPAIEKEAVERFKLEQLGFGEVPGYEEPYFGGQIRSMCHRVGGFQRKAFVI